MPPRRPELPQSLKDEIDSTSHSESNQRFHHARASRHKNSRKDERQQRRTAAKQRKAAFMTDKAILKRIPNDQTVPRKRRKVCDNPSAEAVVTPVHQALASSFTSLAPVQPPKKRERFRGGDPTGFGDVREFLTRSKVEEDEDAYIAALEARLGLDRKKSAKNGHEAAFADDGILDLLQETDEIVRRVKRNEHSSRDTDYTEPSKDDELCSSTEEWGGIDVDDNDIPIPTTSSATIPLVGVSPLAVPDPLQSHGSTTNALNDAQGIKLRRTVKGLLNRLSEQNMEGIINEIEGLYRNHRRHDVTSTLTDIIIEGICAQSLLLDSFITVHAGLIACLYKIIGVEIGAHFTHSVIESFLRQYTAAKVDPATHKMDGSEASQGKECINLMLLLSDLYNLKVVSCLLVYDIVREILKSDLNEMDVELLLKLVKGSGTQLRADDPSSLGDIIQLVHAKLLTQSVMSSRTRFMMEVLDELKQNKTKRQQAYVVNPASERLSKFVAGLGKKRHVISHEPLRVSLEDLRQANTKGKWWLVGAAWGGDPLVDRRELHQSDPDSTDKTSENALLKLSRKQGMNTDIRRSVFVILMSSDDYVDACERLSLLNLTELQQREIIRVLVHCCGNESIYNPYYTLIGQQLCQRSHDHRITLQYCLWDFLRSLGESSIGGSGTFGADEKQQGFDNAKMCSRRIANVSKAYGWWIAKDSIAITVLKPVDFTNLRDKTRMFLRELFSEIFISAQEGSRVHGTDVAKINQTRNSQSLKNIVIKASRNPGLAAGLVHFFASWQISAKDGHAEFMQWSLTTAIESLQGMVDNSVD